MNRAARGAIRLAIAATAASFAAGATATPAGTPPAPYDQPPTPSAAPAAPRTITGVASWYGRTGKGHWGEPTVAWYTRETKYGPAIEYYAAAGPAARELIGDDNPYHEHYPVRVTNRMNGRSIWVIIVDWCSCSSGHKGEKAIDLSPAAFQALGAPLSRGILPVDITLLP